MEIQKKKFVKPSEKLEEADEVEEEFEEVDAGEGEVEAQQASKKPVKAEAVQLVDVVKDTELAFKVPSGEVLNMHGYLVWLGNQVHKLNQAIVGA